jgi:hypothetical protein
MNTAHDTDVHSIDFATAPTIRVLQEHKAGCFQKVISTPKTKQEFLDHYAKQYGVSDPRDVYKMLTSSWQNWTRVARENIVLAQKGNNKEYYLRQVKLCRTMKQDLLKIREEVLRDVIDASVNLQAFIATGAQIARCLYCREQLYSGCAHECVPIDYED